MRRNIELIGCHTEGEVDDVIVDAAALGFDLAPHEAPDLASLGVEIAAAATEQLDFRHPENPDWRHISFCPFAGPIQACEDRLETRTEARCAIHH